MKYQFFGKRTNYVGKTLWEIVGNLKNFGVGRYVIATGSETNSLIRLYKILQVQPLPPPKDEFKLRKVMVFVHKFYNGTEDSIRLKDASNMTKFQLVPKSEEGYYIKLHEEKKANFSTIELPKYLPWPPLYKKLWETEKKKRNLKDIEMPKLDIVLNPTCLKVAKPSKEEIAKDFVPELYLMDRPVEEMIEEIVKLKKIINEHQIKSEL